MPEGEITTFYPESIKSNGCSGKYNVFVINGKWENETLKPLYSFSFNLKLENEQKDKAICDYNSNSIKELKCRFEGEGDIKFEEQYFLFDYLYGLYKIQKYDSSIHVNKCNYSIRTKFNWIILLILSILLF